MPTAKIPSGATWQVPGWRNSRKAVLLGPFPGLCIHEFLAIVTHPKSFAPPTPLAAAMDQVEAWLESPTLVMLSESDGYWGELRTTIEAGRVVGPLVHDARVAALYLQHGVRELWSADRDFGRFPRLTTTNPLVA